MNKIFNVLIDLSLTILWNQQFSLGTNITAFVALALEFLSSRTYIQIVFFLIFIKILPSLLLTKSRPLEPGQFWLPTNINPHE